MAPDSAPANNAIERLEEQLRQAQKMETVALLAGGIAHDFNNLLTVINGYNDLMLASAGLPDEVRKCIAINQRAGRRAARLVRALLSFGARMPLEPCLIEINPLVTELSTLVSSFLPPNIEFSAVLEPLAERVFADPGGIQQVLLNLVINSRDAMLHGGKLEIRTAGLEATDSSDPHLPPGNYVILTVTDTGAGMDDETKRRLFEAYYTTKPAGSGTGLGLHMVHQIVKRSGGFLRVDSALGSGSTVQVYLPCAGGGTVPGEGSSKSQPRGGTETVLLVEDNADLRRLLCSLLENLGYAVLEAESAGEAMQLSNGLCGVIDLLVADVSLADSTGTELARRLQTSRQGLPVLHISGYREEDAAESRSVPDAEFLSKPFTMDAFGERVRHILDKRRRRRVLFVDDDPEVVIFASRVLRDAGFEVLVGGNGNVAISTAQTEPLDLVITDLVMPEREGLETIMRLRKSHPSLPVIAISGAFGGHFLKGAATLGAAAILLKPFTGEELLEAVRAAMEIA